MSKGVLLPICLTLSVLTTLPLVTTASPPTSYGIRVTCDGTNVVLSTSEGTHIDELSARSKDEWAWAGLQTNIVLSLSFDFDNIGEDQFHRSIKVLSRFWKGPICWHIKIRSGDKIGDLMLLLRHIEDIEAWWFPEVSRVEEPEALK